LRTGCGETENNIDMLIGAETPSAAQIRSGKRHFAKIVQIT
jgi:hypothetical protein